MSSPKVAICVPVKDSEIWLAKNLSLIDQFGDEVSRVIISYGESTDNTLEIIRRWVSVTHHKVEVITEPVSEFNVNSSGEIAFIYHDFQTMIEEGDDTHVLLWDDDVVDAPKNLIFEKVSTFLIKSSVFLAHKSPG